jgi:MOSC domain-containing protein YiiM
VSHDDHPGSDHDHRSGTIEALFLKPAPGEPMAPVEAAAAVQGEGLRGDAAYGRPKRQVLLIEGETLDELALLALLPGDVRENVTVRGARLAGLAPGTLLTVGDVVLEVTMDCAPCDFMNDLRPGLRDATEGRRGTLARVLSGGELRRGDRIAVGAPAPQLAGEQA